MDLAALFQLYGFVPVLATGAVFWFERTRRHGAQKRSWYLAAALGVLAALGITQGLSLAAGGGVPAWGPQVFVVSQFLGFAALGLLEYAVHVKRIEESFLVHDFRRSYRKLLTTALVAGVPSLLILAAPLGLPGLSMKLLVLLVGLAFLGLSAYAAWGLFDLQAGVIRRRRYPFVFHGLATLGVLGPLLGGPPTDGSDAGPLALGWYLLVNFAFIVRLVEEFFFWSQYNLRSDRLKMEQRQHTQEILIRRVIAGDDEGDIAIVRELMEAALEKAVGRLAVADYRLTGLAAYRAEGGRLKVEDPRHVLGYCTPLADHKTLKNFDRSPLVDLLLRSPLDLQDWTEGQPGPAPDGKDFGRQLVRTAFQTRRTAVTTVLPEVLKGLQRLAVVVPVLDGDKPLGMLAAYKDSFDQLYPAEREVLEDLGESLATVWALKAGKAVQKERLRLAGEMAAARNLQTSILPRNPVLAGYEVAASMETASEVGGDVFDFVPAPWGTYFGIGDVAGHGLPAGMMAALSMAALQGAVEASRVLGRPLPLGEVYDSVNRVLCQINRDRIGSDKFMTQNYFLAHDGGIDHVGAHLVAPVWRAASGTIERLESLAHQAGFLGLSEHLQSQASVGTFVLLPGDVLVLYSDGASEARDAKGRFFGLEGIEAVLLAHPGAGPQALLEALKEAVRCHAEGGDFAKHRGHYADDVTFVVIRKV